MEKKSKTKERFLLFLDICLLLLRMSRLIFRPKDISPIFRGRSFRNHLSMRLALESLRSKPEVAELIDNRYLSPEPYNLQEFLKLPEGTLGRVFAEHMERYKLEVVFYPPLEDKEDDDITYLRLRARQTHDVHHVVLGIPAVDTGEMAISAFYLAQNKIPLSGLLIGIGFFRAVLKEPQRIDELMMCITKGWEMGKKAKDVLGVKWEDLWQSNIAEVRARLNIQIEPELEALAENFTG